MGDISTYYHDPVFAYLLVKLSSRCNINCTYCYWFRDKSVYDTPKILTHEAEEFLCKRLEAHINQYELDEFTVLLHGGEPLLFGKERFEGLMISLKGISVRTNCNIISLISTNAILVDDEWAELFKRYDVSVSVSIDGPRDIHDKNRIDFAGKGTHDRVIAGLDILKKHEVPLGVIAVCNPDQDPDKIVRHIVTDLGIKKFDILPPDSTHDDVYRPIAPFYNKLFNNWMTTYGPQGVEIRILKGIIQGLFGGRALVTDSIGYGPVHTVTLLTDGSLEPLDVLRIAGNSSTKTGMNIKTHTFQDVLQNPVWRRAFDASLSLHEKCNRCEYMEACGGGHLAHRWSSANEYDNPSVYCEDWQSIFQNVWTNVASVVKIKSNSQSIRLIDALELLDSE